MEIAKIAKEASLKISDLSTEIKNQALLKIAEEIENSAQEIFDANKQDLNNAEKLVEAGKLSKSTFNRLKLDENKILPIYKQK